MTLAPPIRAGGLAGALCAMARFSIRSRRIQVAAAARLLRSISPSDGEIEILLHEIARRLEQIAEPDRPRRTAYLPTPAQALESGEDSDRRSCLVHRGPILWATRRRRRRGAEDRMGAVEQVLGELAELAVETQPQKVRRRSRDFYWYSPILKRELDDVTADAVVTPRDEAEIVRTVSPPVTGTACH